MKAAAKTERTPPEFHRPVFARARPAALLQKEQREDQRARCAPGGNAAAKSKTAGPFGTGGSGCKTLASA
jgi:hypothetical protein